MAPLWAASMSRLAYESRTSLGRADEFCSALWRFDSPKNWALLLRPMLSLCSSEAAFVSVVAACKFSQGCRIEKKNCHSECF